MTSFRSASSPRVVAFVLAALFSCSLSLSLASPQAEAKKKPCKSSVKETSSAKKKTQKKCNKPKLTESPSPQVPVASPSQPSPSTPSAPVDEVAKPITDPAQPITDPAKKPVAECPLPERPVNLPALEGGNKPITEKLGVPPAGEEKVKSDKGCDQLSITIPPGLEGGKKPASDKLQSPPSPEISETAK